MHKVIIIIALGSVLFGGIGEVAALSKSDIYISSTVIPQGDIGLIRIPSRVPVSRSLARATPRAVNPEAITFNAIKPGAT